MNDTTFEPPEPVERPRPLAALLGSVARRVVLSRFSRIAEGDLTLIEGADVLRVGRRGDPLRATITIHDPRFWGAVAAGGTNGGAEAFMEGWWSTDDLVAVVRIAARAGGGAPLEAGRLSAAQWLARAGHALKSVRNREHTRAWALSLFFAVHN